MVFTAAKAYNPPLPKTWAETRAEWSGSDWLAVISIPLVFVVVTSIVRFAGVSRTSAIVDALIRIALCAGLLWIYRPLLADHWAGFRARLWRNIGLVVAGAVLLQVIITLVSALIPNPAVANGDSQTQLIDPATAHGWDIPFMLCT